LESHFAQNPDDLKSAVALVIVSNVNQAAARLVGADEEAVLLGPLDPDLVDDLSSPSFIAQLKGIWDSSDAIRTTLTGTTLSGATFDAILEWHAPRVFGSPDYSRVLVTIVDITEQKEAERKARERLKSKDEFIASISHELRTPLTSVLGFAELLRSMDEGDYSEERDALLGIISSQATDLSDLVEDLLVAARFQLGQLSVAEVPVNVHAQIAQVLEARPPEDEQIRAPARPSQPVMASGDPQRVRQILRNLITNANRYGGAEVVIEVNETPETVAISVIDNGDGLEPGQEDRVFEKYARNTDDAYPDSVGLGLTIARDLAWRMNGNLTYARRDGWTSFTLILPALIQPQTDH
jgi:signal transduction histidine kinase